MGGQTANPAGQEGEPGGAVNGWLIYEGGGYGGAQSTALGAHPTPLNIGEFLE